MSYNCPTLAFLDMLLEYGRTNLTAGFGAAACPFGTNGMI
jgi:hypothetical protein